MTAPGSAMPLEPEDATSQRAAGYFQRRRFWEWSDSDQAELDAWLAESILHRVAYLRVEGIAAHADRLAALRPSKHNRYALGRMRKLMRRRFVVPFLAAASIALMAVFAGPYVIALMQPPDRSFSTDVGGHTLLKFTDGTEIELNTDTAMRFRMTTAERTVWLESGEAWFHVAHDAAHPFTVVIGNHRVTDLGTEFFARRGSGNVEVALVAGRAMLNTEGTPAAILTPGDDAVATPISVSVTRKTPQQLADALAWRRGMLVFRNTKLADAIREINRYNTVKLVIVDPSIVDLRFNGEIKDDNLDDFLETAQTMMKLRAERHGQNTLLSRDTSEKHKRPRA